TPLAVVVWLGHPQPPEPRQAGGNHAEGASPRGPRLLPPPGDERGQRGAQCEAAADQEHGLRLPQPRALQDRDLLPLRRPRSLPGYPLKTRKSLVFFALHQKLYRLLCSCGVTKTARRGGLADFEEQVLVIAIPATPPEHRADVAVDRFHFAEGDLLVTVVQDPGQMAHQQGAELLEGRQ